MHYLYDMMPPAAIGSRMFEQVAVDEALVTFICWPFRDTNAF